MMARNALTEDPLVAHGLTLGRAWQQARDGAGTDQG